MSGGSSSAPLQSDAVELNTIEVRDGGDAGPLTPAKDDTTAAAPGAAVAVSLETKGKQKETATEQAANDPLSIDQPADAEPASPTTALAAALTAGDGGPVCSITLLLPTGARHPFRIDEKYLAKRSVDVPEFTEDGKKDPLSISVYKLKELIPACLARGLGEQARQSQQHPADPLRQAFGG